VMYKKGQGVLSSKIVAYALYNVSAANDSSADNPATSNRTALVLSMSQKEIDEGQDLTREMSKSGNLLKALDAYFQKKSETKKKKK
jgi:hypothetical protein